MDIDPLSGKFAVIFFDDRVKLGETFGQLSNELDENYDFKNQFSNKFEYINFLVEQLQNFDYKNLSNDDFIWFMKIIDKILTKIIEVNNDELVEIFLSYLVELSIFLNDNNLERWNLELLKSINIFNPKKDYPAILKQYFSLLTYEFIKSKNRYFTPEASYLHLYRMFSEELILWYKIVDIQSTSLVYSIGLTFHLDGIYQHGRVEKRSSLKAGFLEDAEKYYKDRCNNIELSKDLRSIIKACYGLVIQNNELSPIKIEQPYSAIQQIEKYQYKKLYFETLKNDDVIKYMSMDKELVPDYKSVLTSVNEIAKEAVFSRSLAVTTINEKRKLGTFVTDREHIEFDTAQYYLMLLDSIWRTRLFPIFDQLIHARKLTQGTLLKHLNQWSLVDKSRMSIYSRAIERFLDNDYISSVSILVPQIEHQLRYMFEVIGYSTTNTPKGKSQEEQTFGTFLADPFVIEQLGIDTVKFFEILFASKVGFNIRNNLAHGLYATEDFGRGLNIIVIYSLILLTKFEPKKSI